MQASLIAFTLSSCGQAKSPLETHTLVALSWPSMAPCSPQIAFLVNSLFCVQDRPPHVWLPAIMEPIKVLSLSLSLSSPGVILEPRMIQCYFLLSHNDFNW